MYKETGCCMSLIVHFLHLNLDFFLENFGEVSNKQGECIHQDIKSMEHHCQCYWNDSDGRLLLDVVPRHFTHIAPHEEKVIMFLTSTFGRTKHVVYIKLCSMPWKCVYVYDLLQFL
jgi:hypothetical protein